MQGCAVHFGEPPQDWRQRPPDFLPRPNGRACPNSLPLRRLPQPEQRRQAGYARAEGATACSRPADDVRRLEHQGWRPHPTAIEEWLEHSAVRLFCMSTQAFGSDCSLLERHTAVFPDPLNRDRLFLTLPLNDAEIKPKLRSNAYIDWRPEADRQAHLGRLLEACGARQRKKGEEAAGNPAASAAGVSTPKGPQAAPPAISHRAKATSTASASISRPARPATAPRSTPPQHPRSVQLMDPGPAPLR